MMSESETFTFTQIVKCEDADGRAIRVGSVLKEISDGTTGVVHRISKIGDTACSPLDQVGDVHIGTSSGSTRVTNRYNQWRHVPHDEQTFEQRFQSWRLTPYDHDEYTEISKDVGLAGDGIMSLLPSDIVDWYQGPFPDDIGTALEFLTKYLTQLKEKQNEKQEKPSN